MSDLSIIGIPGSLREDSYNRALLETSADIAPEGMQIEIIDLDPIPMYDADVEPRAIRTRSPNLSAGSTTPTAC